MAKVLIVPDVHGRKFWHKAMEMVDEVDQVVFLGDYLDPYSREHISKEQAITNFKEVISFKKDYSDKVILLIGNHDYYYLPKYKNDWACRRDNENFDTISDLFTSNLNYFNISYRIGNYLFTHAGVLKGWLDVINGKRKVRTTVKINLETEITIDNLNTLLESELLDMIAEERGGRDSYGSPIWADVHEHLYDWGERIPNIYQVFGHTMSYPSIKEAYINSNFAMLDSQNCWLLEDGEFKRID